MPLQDFIVTVYCLIGEIKQLNISMILLDVGNGKSISCPSTILPSKNLANKSTQESSIPH